MTTWNRKRGDVKDTIVVALQGVADITGATVVGHVKLGAVKKALTGTVLNAIATGPHVQSDGTIIYDQPCSVTLQLGVTAAVDWLPIATIGTWRLTEQLTFPDGTVKTWPSEGYDAIIVEDQDDPA